MNQSCLMINDLYVCFTPCVEHPKHVGFFVVVAGRLPRGREKLRGKILIKIVYN